MKINKEEIKTLQNLSEKYIKESSFHDAKLIYNKLLKIDPDNHFYIARLAYVELLLNNFTEAKTLFLNSISICSNYTEGYNCLGYIFKAEGDFVQAEYYFNQALNINKNYLPALTNLANLMMSKDPLKAIQILTKALSIDNDNVQINYNLGIAYVMIKDYDKAIKFYTNSILINPKFIPALFNLGNLNFSLRRFKKALNFYQQVIEIDSFHADSLSNIGTCLQELGNINKAKFYYKKALENNPNHVNSLNSLAVLYINTCNTNMAINLLKKVVILDSNNPIYLYNLANAFKEKGDFLKSIDYLKKAILLDKYFYKAHADLIHLKHRLCDWEEFENDLVIANRIGIKGDKPIVHLGMLAMYDDPKTDLIRAKRLFKFYFDVEEKSIIIKQKKIIRLGYISANFNDHPVIQLLIRTLELHDSSKFELYLYSLDNHKTDSYTSRIKNLKAKYIPIENLSNSEQIELIRSHDIDIAIDLMGYTKGNNFIIFAHRIAPIQISYLGYPGSTGSDCIDYIIADQYLIPNNMKKYYSEKVVYLPLTYQCNDDQLPRICKSPELNKDVDFNNKFVFTCFNSSYKISPIEFDIWMNLLKRVDESILWLYESSEETKLNLLNSAKIRGIDPKRLVFAETLPLNDHIIRHQNADLFLDTFNYSAGATAFIALKAGTPIIAYEGKSYTSRMSSSILNALGLNKLIARSLSEYEELAFNLATNYEFFDEIKNKLYDLNDNSKFFNSDSFVQDYESLLIQIYSNHI
ncbi:tetratricopeptide repeat protein [Prochlorococcus sp. MIT 0801]|uniref:tetratricopeptide repeat protein n=1 Tax=Prochlorococcus sp. MIT 0801 TaxID=1501269 RepID=UPI0004F7F610|nr:tetratricopeptide repeat protein [Prochlorococcus sp. MIT 0801]AIQ98286.1 TPR repeat [Prochlorococcus sp. MIT 0801]